MIVAKIVQNFAFCIKKSLLIVIFCKKRLVCKSNFTYQSSYIYKV